MFISRLSELMDEFCNGSQKVLSQKTQIPASTISHWFARDGKPTYIQIVKICDAFHVSADYLLGRENDVGVVVVTNSLPPDQQELIDLYTRLSPRNKSQLIGFAKGLQA